MPKGKLFDEKVKIKEEEKRESDCEGIISSHRMNF
jgi:hypothetical protein